ncbi:MAG: packaged DNA stabilization protein gp10 [Deltaproteobacteria bacterium]|nr:packaged DNA stabilization protein gp10 [Deltaproteobacteria bacterium]
MNPQIFGAGLNGRNRVVSTQRRLNYYYGWDQPGTPAQGPDRGPWAIYDRPPLTQKIYLGANRIRGLFRFSSSLWVVQGSKFIEVLPNYTYTERGTLNTKDGRVTMDAIQGVTGFQIGICDGTNFYIFNVTTSTFTVVAGAPALTSITAGHSYFIGSVANSGKWNVSALGDGASWPGLSFTTADADPDNLVAVRHYGDTLYLFGERSTEFWGFSGVGSPPWQRISQNAVSFGLASAASIAPFGDGLMVLAQSAAGEGGRGEVSVYSVQGNQFQRVSHPDLEHIINGYSDAFQAEGCSWSINGHLQYRLFFPSSKVSWMYDAATQLWSEESAFGGVSAAPSGFGPHRGATASGFNSVVVFGDYADGSLWAAEPRKATYADQLTKIGGQDQPIERELVGRHLYEDGNRMQILAALELDCNSGDGIDASPTQLPQIMLSLSRDKGRTWGKERLRTLGAVGQYRTRVRWQNLGRARDIVVKIRVTDPVRCTITGEVLVPGSSSSRSGAV